MKKIVYLLLLFFICFSCNNNDDDGNNDNGEDPINCTLVFVYGLDVTVIDANSNAVITNDVQVTATDGDYEETLMRIEGDSNFFGAGERAGNYTIEITAPGYQTFTSGVITVNEDECHVITRVLEFAINPN